MIKENLDAELGTIIECLSQPLSDEESQEGWTTQSKAAISKYFQDKRLALNEGKPTADWGLVRGLDAWGIQKGNLWDKALGVNAKLR